jgi:hypothetical protein
MVGRQGRSRAAGRNRTAGQHGKEGQQENQDSNTAWQSKDWMCLRHASAELQIEPAGVFTKLRLRQFNKSGEYHYVVKVSGSEE